MEICVDSVVSALNAEAGGASRLELCANLVEGGTTPTSGLLRVVKRRVKIPVFAMVRPRGGDFAYTEDEFSVMEEDVRVLKSCGADGFVFGILTPSGGVDVERCSRLLELCRPFPVTFHRAFDMVKDPFESLEDILRITFDRVLTSGRCSTALGGMPLISQLVERAGTRAVIVPGGGINEENLETLLRGTRAKEFHCSARVTSVSKMEYRHVGVMMGSSYQPDEFVLKVADVKRASALLSIATGVWLREQQETCNT